jgi:putative transposase
LYVWRLGEEVPVQRVPENVAITTEFMAMFHEHLSIFGSPRIHQVLLALGRHDGRDWVARLMRRAQVRARTRKAFRPSSSHSRGAVGVVENLMHS